MKIKKEQWKWTREPAEYKIEENRIEIVTEPHTDLWQRTYYHFRNDNAPVLQIKTSEKYFSFVVKTEFQSKHRFDQCGIVMYLDSDNWLKGSIEYENDEFQHLGSVVTNMGYSDWATTEIDANIKSMWYRFSRREDDYCIECSEDGIRYKQMRICHMWNAAEEIQFGIYACSPENSSFKAVFTDMELTECKWLAHDGQAPDAKKETKIHKYVSFYKSIVDQDRSSVVICNLEHEIIYMNPAAVMNYEKRGGDKLIGKSLLDCHNQDSKEKIKQVMDWFAADENHNIVYTFHNEKQNKDVYMVALREEGKLIGYYEKHEYRNAETRKPYDLW